jgi:hypothetical protein
VNIVIKEVRDGGEHEVLKSSHVLVALDGTEHPIVEPKVGVPYDTRFPAVHCKVSIAGKPACISDLHEGTECELTIVDDKVVEVKA